MDAYRPCLHLDVAHAYYADGRCRGLQFTPTADTADWLRREQALCVQTGSGLSIYAPPGRPPAADATELGFTVRAADPLFAAVTEGLPETAQETLVFDCPGLQPQADAVWMLHGGATASHRDAWPLRWPRVTELLTARDRRLPPAFVVRVAAPDPGRSAGGGVRCRIAFGARSPVWKYCLVGPWSTASLEVVGDGSEPGFEAPAAESLDDGRKVLAIRSRAGIALRERSDLRLQLRERSARGDRVLVKRLPLAGAGHFTRETVTGAATLVCEILVHR